MTCANALNRLDYGEFLIDECQELIRVCGDWNSEVRRLRGGNSHLSLREIRFRDPPPVDDRLNARSSRAAMRHNPPAEPPPATDQLSFRIHPPDPGSPPPQTQSSATRATHGDGARSPAPDCGFSDRDARRRAVRGQTGTMSADAPPPPRMKVFRGHRETKQKIRAFEAAFRASLVASTTRIRAMNRAAARKRIRALPPGRDFWAPIREHRETARG